MAVARRVVGRDIQRGEVVKIVLDLWTTRDGESHPSKNFFRFTNELRQWMKRPALRFLAWLCRIDPFCLAELVEFRCLEFRKFRRNRRFDFVFDFVRKFTDLAFFFCW